MPDSFLWSADAGEVQLGLRLSALEICTGEAVTLTLAARNRSARQVTLAPQLALLVRRGDAVDEHGSGPRAPEGIALDPGETREIAGWRLTGEQLGSEPGARVVWAACRAPDGSELRSGEAQIDVLA